jgi:GNAT superfamily N-acetyltransferase
LEVVTKKSFSPHVRAAGASDLSEVLRLYGQLHPNDHELDDVRATQVLDEILQTPGMTLMVLEGVDQLAATAYLNVIPNLARSGARPYALIENVVVDVPLRGTGIGKQIMAATLNAAWAAGCYKAMLLTGSQRPSNHAFYRACGFAGDEKSAYVAHP